MPAIIGLRSSAGLAVLLLLDVTVEELRKARTVICEAALGVRMGKAEGGRTKVVEASRTAGQA